MARRSTVQRAQDEPQAQWLVAAIVCLVSTPQIYRQMGFPSIKRPNIANIFHPVVGSGTAYEPTSSDGSKKTLEMSIVGMEMLGTQQGIGWRWGTWIAIRRK